MIFPSPRGRDKAKIASSLQRLRIGLRAVTGVDHTFVFQLLILIPIAISDSIPFIVLNINLQTHWVAIALASEKPLLLCSEECGPDVFTGFSLPLKVRTCAGNVNGIFFPEQVDSVFASPDNECLYLFLVAMSDLNGAGPVVGIPAAPNLGGNISGQTSRECHCLELLPADLPYYRFPENFRTGFSH